MRKKPLLLIEWEDHATYGAWRDEAKTDDVKPMLCQTVGWKFKAPKGKMCIGSTRNSVGECADRTMILKASIISIKRLDNASKD